ncbi:beta-mannosidase [Stenotrophomonas pictorum JCM 9942]|uniref:Beta-mannosidase n=1 Tax=Stenotrophomonas pictorum JCM 9942 TaxID=1236960 RepID=A0A0R0A8L9_9GAMM|nr:glycoside hydrolase family 2 protein [Stenotrophomonas pictorum]KRG40905.1 beta-mannosidase [Stenotrophomonas pictorum JCM 9942]
MQQRSHQHFQAVAPRLGWVRRALAACLLCGLAGAALAAPLQAQWSFRLLPGDAQLSAHPGMETWRAATVPGSVHTDLLANGLIGDPYVGAVEAGLQWIGLGDWEYRARFDVDAATLARPHAELRFDGLDTFAEVRLNGRPLLQADNAHRTWRARVDGQLRATGNELRIVFRSPIRTLLPQVQAMEHKIAGNYPSPYGDEPKDAMVGNFVRKPAYHFGWDWGPRYVTAGVWRQVHIDSWDDQRITDLAVRTDALDADRAALSVLLQVEHSAAAGKVPVALAVLDPEGKPVAQLRRQVALQPGSTTLELPVEITRPRRWWPVGYGAQERYTVQVRIGSGVGEALSSSIRTGLRTVQLQRDEDADGGQGFAFVINGVPVFAKGVNAIPFDAFPSRVTRERLRRDLQSARDANMNMVRNWGGGYYESEDFFDLADELGLLVWQDFMFGGGMQPGFDPAFRANVVAEARDNIRRLRHHPSIVLWCGNNEEETAWKDWGHGKTLKEADPVFADKVWQGYVELFGNDLRAVVAEEGLGVPYWSSSPSNDLDTKANDSRRGDKHYWDVWGGPALPPTAYLKETPRFMSEYGLQAWPQQSTVDAFATRDEQQIDGPVIRAHQKFMAGEGNTRLLHYIAMEYGTPRSFADFVYLGQAMQAEGIALAALHHRASRPYTMGSLYWQLNDVWPGASWSSVDYYGNWKALHYHARRFFAEVAVAALRDEGNTSVSLLNDGLQPLPAQWRLRVLDFDGRVLQQREQALTLAPQSATAVARLSDAELLQGADPRRSVAVFDLMRDGTLLAQRLVYFTAAKDQALAAGQLQTELRAVGDHHVLQLRSAGLVRGIWIGFDKNVASVEDNAFDLLPGQSRELVVRGAADLATLRKALQVRTLGDTL